MQGRSEQNKTLETQSILEEEEGTKIANAATEQTEGEDTEHRLFFIYNQLIKKITKTKLKFRFHHGPKF